MRRQRREDISSTSNEDTANNAFAHAADAHQQQHPQGQGETLVDGESNDKTGEDQQVFYQVNLNSITNALLVPGDMLSAKLQPLGPVSAPEVLAASSISISTSSVNDALDGGDRGGGGGGGGNSNSSSVEGSTPTGRRHRYRKHYNTLKAAVLPAPDNTYYVEDTLVIGSLSCRGGQASFLENKGGFACENGEAKKSSVAGRSPALSATQSAPIALTGSSSALVLGQQGDFLSTPSLRGVTFSVRKPSRTVSALDDVWDDGGDLGRPLLADINTTNATTITTTMPNINKNNNINNIDTTSGASGSGVGNSSSKKPRKTKRVHFPENVIKSVSVLQADDQLRLLVQYNRPWYVHLVLAVASAFFVLHWGFTVLLIRPYDGMERVASSAVVSFVAFGFASVYLLAFLALTWRPGSSELEFLMDFSRCRPVIHVLLAGVAAQLLLVCSFMFEIGIVSLVCFCCCPLVLTYLYEEYKKHSVSALDGVACVLVVASFVVFTAGVEVEEAKSALYCIAPVVISTLGGAAMAFFLFQVRTVSRYVSNLFVMSSTVTLSTVVLGFVAYAVGGFATPIGASHRPLSDVSSADFLKMILGALFLFLSWFTYHWSSLFFDRMTLSGSFSLGGPISLLVFHLLSLPTASLPYEIAGGVAMATGCSLVLFSGFRFRQNVEVRIELER